MWHKLPYLLPCKPRGFGYSLARSECRPFVPHFLLPTSISISDGMTEVGKVNAGSMGCYRAISRLGVIALTRKAAVA